MLRAQALSLGLSDEAAASLADAKDAVREVAHRLHYHMRRASRLEGAIEAVREERSALHKGGNHTQEGLPLTESGPENEDAETRVREVDELREKLSAVRRAREREAIARAALESEHAALKTKLEELQRSVQLAAEARLKIETKASELSDQKKLLVREVKTTRRAIAKVQAELEAPDEESHRVLALRRVGLDKSGASNDAPGEKASTKSSDLGSDTDTSSDLIMSSASRYERLEDALKSQPSNASTSSGLGTTTDILMNSFAAASRSSGLSTPPPRKRSPKLNRNHSGAASLPAESSPFALICKRCSGTVEGPQFSTCRCSEPAL